MADFRALKGLYIKATSSDPSNLIEGDIWYNTTTRTIKVAPLIGTWAAGENATTVRHAVGSAGTQTAGLIFAGTAPGGLQNATEEYDGTDWTNSGNYGGSAYSLASFGIQTAAIGAGGHPGLETEAYEYNGSTWSAIADVNTGVISGSGAGTTAAGIKFGGAGAGSFTDVKNESEEWNGTSWAEGNNLNTARGYITGFGTQTATLGAGGYTSPPFVKHTNVESYDGTSWTASTVLPVGRMQGSASGIQTAAFLYGGSTTAPTATAADGQTWDGSAWTTSPASLVTGRRGMGGSPAGTSVSALASVGPAAPGDVASTEEFTSVATARTMDTT